MYKFLIYIAHPYSIPIGRPLEREILTRGFEVHWFSELEYTKAYFDDAASLIHSAADVISYNPDIVLTAADVVPDFFPGIKVQIFHGFRAEKREIMKDHFRIRGMFDLYTTQGPSTTEIFKQLAAKNRTFEVVETGWSKVDPLFPILSKEPGSRPVIMISSTFTTRLSLAKNEEVYQEIRRLSESGKYEFICVLHPILDQETKDRFIALNGPNFTYYDTTDLIPLFRKADIMFADTTSAIIEFLLQEKPVVTFRHHIPKEYLINVIRVPDIEPALQEALRGSEALRRKIREFIQWTHPYFDGCSSARIVDASIRFYTHDQSHLRKKPLNLVRKWQIRKKLGYFTFKSYNIPQTIFVRNKHAERRDQ